MYFWSETREFNKSNEVQEDSRIHNNLFIELNVQ